MCLGGTPKQKCYHNCRNLHNYTWMAAEKMDGQRLRGRRSYGTCGYLSITVSPDQASTAGAWTSGSPSSSPSSMAPSGPCMAPWLVIRHYSRRTSKHRATHAELLTRPRRSSQPKTAGPSPFPVWHLTTSRSSEVLVPAVLFAASRWRVQTCFATRYTTFWVFFYIMWILLSCCLLR
jgi:hypothetical protein